MLKLLISFSLLLLLLLSTGCDTILLGETENNDVVNNFDLLWNDYNDHYANFRVKNIDWAAEYDLYRPQLNNSSTEADLYNVLVPMLGKLNDGHVELITWREELPEFESGFAATLSNSDEYIFDETLVRRNYLEAVLGEDYGDIFHGMLPNNIGYMYWGEMPEMDLPFVEQVIGAMMEDLADTDGIIIDIRDNNGGEDEAGRLIAGYFTNDEPLYMLSRYKIGPGADDFEPMREWRVADRGTPAYDKPVVLLTDRFSVSAGETFALALWELPQVTMVGDTTTGAFSDTVDRELPNRWYYRIPVAEVFDGQGRSWEGIGLPPDLVIRNTPEEVNNGQDRMLELALEQF